MAVLHGDEWQALRGSVVRFLDEVALTLLLVDEPYDVRRRKNSSSTGRGSTQPGTSASHEAVFNCRRNALAVSTPTFPSPDSFWAKLRKHIPIFVIQGCSQGASRFSGAVVRSSKSIFQTLSATVLVGSTNRSTSFSTETRRARIPVIPTAAGHASIPLDDIRCERQRRRRTSPVQVYVHHLLDDRPLVYQDRQTDHRSIAEAKGLAACDEEHELRLDEFLSILQNEQSNRPCPVEI